MKIIIIGAGISGLTLALACQKAGMEVKIYENAKKLRNIGGGLLLWPHGTRYLEWLGLSDCLQPYRVPVKRCNIVGTEGQTIFSEDYAAFYALLGGQILPIDRSLLQQALVAKLPENILVTGKQCINIKTGPDAAEVTFADGTTDSADLVIGADGIHSTVRNIINNKSELEYTNYCWWGGIIEQKDVPGLPADEVFVAIGIGKMCIVWPTHGEKFMWYLPVKMTAAELAREGNGWSQLQDICAGWHPEVEKIINAPGSTQRFHLPIYTLPPQQHWSSARVTLIGDAAHAIGPILGQGANLAIEDVFVLLHCLQQDSDNIFTKLERYETFRHARARRLYELETQSAAAMVNDDIETLEAFQGQLPQLDLATIYQDLIPLIDETACQELASAILQDVRMVPA